MGNIMFSSLLNLEDNFVFYGSHHHNKINKIIHIICIPGLMWTVLTSLCYVKFYTIKVDNPIYEPLLTSDAGIIMILIYGMYYVLLDVGAGIVAKILLISMWLISKYIVAYLPIYIVVPTIIAIHIICWIAQFIGHGVFEKKQPALLTGLIQAFLTAFLFVILEVMFLLRYKPMLKERLDIEIESKLSNGQYVAIP